MWKKVLILILLFQKVISVYVPGVHVIVTEEKIKFICKINTNFNNNFEVSKIVLNESKSTVEFLYCVLGPHHDSIHQFLKTMKINDVTSLVFVSNYYDSLMWKIDTVNIQTLIIKCENCILNGLFCFQTTSRISTSNLINLKRLELTLTGEWKRCEPDVNYNESKLYFRQISIQFKATFISEI